MRRLAHLVTLALLTGCPDDDGGGTGTEGTGGTGTASETSATTAATAPGTDSGGGTCIDDVDEPNDSPDDAIPLVPGSSLDDSDVTRNPALCPGDVDFYSFTMDGANYLIAEARFDRSMGNLRLSVLGSGGTVLWSSAGGRLAAVHRFVDSSGSFLLRVEHVSGTAKLDYSVRVRALPAMP